MTDQDAVSNLWSRLINMELSQVRSDPELSSRLLVKPAVAGNIVLQDWAKEAQSSTESADYFQTICQYMMSSQSSESLRQIVQFVEDLSSGKVEFKSSMRATKFREEGNSWFKQGQFEAASAAYRHGLLYAPNISASSTSSEMDAALLHGNLSASLFHQKLWNASLWEALTALIILSNKNVFAEFRKTTQRLWARVKSCMKQLCLPQGTSENAREIRRTLFFGRKHEPSANDQNLPASRLPVPRYGFQDEYPGLSTGLKVNNTTNKGRHVIACANFDPGDVLAVEPASGYQDLTYTLSEFTAQNILLLPSQRHLRCTACSAPLDAIGYVCPYCCEAAYCPPPSVCFSRHWSYDQNMYVQPQWHLSECRFMYLLNSTGLGHLCFRLALSRKQHSMCPVAPIEGLVDHFAEFDVEDLFQYALTGWLLSHILSKTTGDAMNHLLGDGLWCFDTMRRLQCNAHALTDVLEDFSETDGAEPSSLRQIRVATGLFPSISMFNHSCEPSVTNCFEENFIILRCTKPIGISDEVFNCYGPHCLHEVSSVIRRTQLREQYFFECDCPHCTQPMCRFTASSSTESQWSSAKEEFFATASMEHPSFGQVYEKWTTCVNIGYGACTDCKTHWWPVDHNPGSLFNTLGKTLLSQSKKSSKLERRRLVGYQCLMCSVTWVYSHYGSNSAEYLWELINLMRVAARETCNLPIWKLETSVFDVPVEVAVPWESDDRMERIRSVASILFGDAKAARIPNQWLGNVSSINPS